MPGSIANAETFSEAFPTYAKRPVGSTVTETGLVPAVGNGEPSTGVRAPLVASIAKAETLPA